MISAESLVRMPEHSRGVVAALYHRRPNFCVTPVGREAQGMTWAAWGLLLPRSNFGFPLQLQEEDNQNPFISSAPSPPCSGLSLASTPNALGGMRWHQARAATSHVLVTCANEPRPWVTFGWIKPKVAGKAAGRRGERCKCGNEEKKMARARHGTTTLGFPCLLHLPMGIYCPVVSSQALFCPPG